ncbi:MAG: stimulus-sensing domain-containing protein [Pseudomonadota bacterium]
MVAIEARSQDGFKTPPPAVFAERRGRFLRASTLGFSRLALQLSIITIVGLFIILAATLRVSDLRGAAADAVAQSLLVQSDALLSAISNASVGEDSEHPALLYRVTEELPESNNEERPRPPAVSTRFDRTAFETVLQDVLEGSQTRLRVFGADGARLVDSTIALSERENADGPENGAPPLNAGLAAAIWRNLVGSLVTPPLPAEPTPDAPAAEFREVAAALGGVKSAELRVDDTGNIIVSVATPVFAGEEVVAAVNLRSEEGAVTTVARAQEIAIVQIFLIAALVAVFICTTLAAMITRPIRRLAADADRIRRGGISTPMPELRDRGEVGELSRVLHDMTVALYARIDSIEAFAGEVAHELKNPLTSLRSAVETLPLARTDKARAQLLDVIQHDVRRIDRLISDISDASKLDAELNRYRYERVDLVDILQLVVDTQAEIAAERNQAVDLVIRGPDDPYAFQVIGNDSRLGQVFTNLIDNARSFTPEGGRVVTTVQRFPNFIEVVVDDEGPGIAEDMLERIFERFYTDRSEQSSFGNNSGLGLAISRQIIEAHNGEIFAENRYRTTLGPERNVAGARFTVRLPSVN